MNLLAHAGALNELAITHCEAVTDAGVVPVLVRVGGGLRTLDFTGTMQLTDTTVDAVAKQCLMVSNWIAAYSPDRKLVAH